MIESKAAEARAAQIEFVEAARRLRRAAKYATAPNASEATKQELDDAQKAFDAAEKRFEKALDDIAKP